MSGSAVLSKVRFWYNIQMKPRTQVSHRFAAVPASQIRKLVPFAEKAKKEGVKVYHFNIGDPDVHTPDVMLEVLHTWERNPVGYASSHGEAPLLFALQTYYHRLGHTFLETKH